MGVYQRILTTHAVPWRLRHGLEQWVEHKGRALYPSLYRWLHLGRASDRTRAVTQGPQHHFFGYYDKTPWNLSGRYLLGHEVNFNDRAPQADDRASIGIVNLGNNNQFEQLGGTSAWNWQQGAMIQWHPTEPERCFVYNDSRDNRFVGVVRDIEKGELAVHERPLYTLLPDGVTAFSLSFSRLATHRPGYGYAGNTDVFANDPHPAGEGIWHMDLRSGHAELIVSLAQLASLNPKPSMQGAWHYVNHIQPSRGGKRIAFFHIWHKDAKSWEVRLYSCRPDGSELTCLLDTGVISHYDWRDDDTILIWANRPDAPARFLMLSHAVSGIKVFAESNLKEDGHCTFSPDGRWILNDTYPDVHQMRTLMVVRVADEKRIDIARLYSPKARWWGEIRCDLHPRWSRDVTQVCFDSVHNGTRQIYVANVGDVTK